MLTNSWTLAIADVEYRFEPTGEKLSYCRKSATTVLVTKTDEDGMGWNCGQIFVARNATQRQVEDQFLAEVAA